MSRINTFSWSDGEVLTRLMHTAQQEMMKYQKHTLPHEDRGKGAMGGDTFVMVSLINLQKRIQQVLDQSPN